MSEDLSKYSAEDRRRITKIARRNVISECVLVLTAGFAALMVLMFFVGSYTFLPLAEALNARPTVVWFLLSIGIAVCWSWLHYIYFQPKISKSRTLSSAFLHQYQEETRLEREAKIRDMQNNK